MVSLYKSPFVVSLSNHAFRGNSQLTWSDDLSQERGSTGSPRTVFGGQLSVALLEIPTTNAI